MLAGRTIVITGAARGVGRAIARACAKAGARLVLGDILVDAGREAVQELGRATVARFVPIDLDSPDSVTAFARDIAEHEGEIHGLVNNAAIATKVGGDAFDAIELDLWDRVMRVNVRGTWLVTRALTPLFAEGGHGRIVNLASDTALWGAPRLLAYVASKGAVISMTWMAAQQLGRHNINVNAICPGVTRTELGARNAVERAAERGITVEALQAEAETRIPIGRANQPEDIAAMAVFLASPAARNITGQAYNVDGGLVPS